MALNVLSKDYGPDQISELQALTFLLQYALENGVDFVDNSDLEDWILGGTDREQDFVFSLDEDGQDSLLTDLNVLLAAAFSGPDGSGV